MVYTLFLFCILWSFFKEDNDSLWGTGVRELKRGLATLPQRWIQEHVEVRATTGCHPLSHLVTDRRLCGFLDRSSAQDNHHRAITAVIRGLPPDWKRPLGRSSHTLLRAAEADLGQQNISLASAWRKAAIRDDWRRIVDTATLQRSTL